MKQEQKTETVFIKFFSIKENQIKTKYFNTYDKAKKWGYENIHNFNIDMIKYI